MYEETVASTPMDHFFQILLGFYPKQYRKRFGQEMFYTFQDLYQEELDKNGKVGLGFWLSIFADTFKSLAREYLNIMKHQGLKNYFHINNYNIIGAIFLLPFVAIFTFGLVGRILQGDLNHYNRAYEGALSHSFLYANYFGKPWLLFGVLIVFPTLGLLINLIPLLNSVIKTKKLSLTKLFLTNPITIFLVLVGLFCLLIVFGHDVVPCFVNGLLYHGGLNNLPQIISVCKNA